MDFEGLYRAEVIKNNGLEKDKEYLYTILQAKETRINNILQDLNEWRKTAADYSNAYITLKDKYEGDNES